MQQLHSWNVSYHTQTHAHARTHACRHTHARTHAIFFFRFSFFFFYCCCCCLLVCWLLSFLVDVSYVWVWLGCCCFGLDGLKKKNHTSSHISLIHPSFNIKYSLKIYTDIYSPVTVKYTQEFLLVTFISNSSLTNKQNITISYV